MQNKMVASLYDELLLLLHLRRRRKKGSLSRAFKHVEKVARL